MPKRGIIFFMARHQAPTVETLKSLAGGGVFQRGQAYFEEDAVERIRSSPQGISATVIGSEPYKVKLWIKKGSLEYSCTCPHAENGNFCKHCVAVGLAWLEDQAESIDVVTDNHENPWAIIQEYLSKQTPELLVEIVLDCR